jgi:hypothetical protein
MYMAVTDIGKSGYLIGTIYLSIFCLLCPGKFPYFISLYQDLFKKSNQKFVKHS